MRSRVQDGGDPLSRLIVVYTTYRESGLEVVGKLESRAGDVAGIVDALGFVVLSTCNRFEVYMDSPSEESVEAIASIIRREGGRPLVARGREAARRLMRIAAGLDSAIIGEPEILGQVRNAWRASRAQGRTTSLLDTVFHAAILAGKRVRRETGISRGNASYPSAAVTIASRLLGGLDGARVLVVGAGKASRGVMKVLCTDYEPGLVVVASRDPGRAMDAARICPSGQALHVSEALEGEYDVAFVAVRGYTIPRPRAAVVVDLSTPPAVEPRDRVYGMEDLEREVRRVIESRKRWVPDAEAIIQEEMAKLEKRLAQRRVSGLLRAIEEYADTLARMEASRHNGDYEATYRMLRSYSKKLLHPLYVGLRETAATAWTLGDLLEVLERLYRERVDRK